MNKKLKFTIPFAVLALSCGIAAAGCGGGHTHDYSAWGHDETQHWRECECGEIEESSKEDHVFVAGECECGATEVVEDLKYGNASGQVKIHKLGEYITDFSDVTVSIDDDDVVCEIDKNTGKFTVTDAVAGKDYTFTVSKPGYVDYSAKVRVKEGDDNVIGGTRGAVLEYKVFSSLVGYDDNLHDYSKVNEAVPTIGVNGDGSKSLDVISTDSYGDVSVSINAKNVNGGGIQGIVLKFEDGTYAILNVNISEKKLQYRPEMWGMKSVWGVNKPDPDNPGEYLPDPNNPGAYLHNWIEYTDKSVVTDAVISSFNSDGGLEVKLIRKGGTLYSFLDGRFIGQVDLPEERAGDEINVGFFSYDVKANAVWNYEITETVPEMAVKTHITVDRQDCSVTANADSYAFGDEILLTINSAENYKLKTIFVNGEDRFEEVKDGKLKIKADYVSVEVEATFTKIVRSQLNLTIKGTKLGKTEVLAENTEVKFKGITEYTFSVGANGVISQSSVIEDRYIVSVPGYKDKKIEFNAELAELGEITLEYDLFAVVRHDEAGHDLTHVNEETPYIEWNGSGLSLNVVSKEYMLDNATVSVTIKNSQSTNGADQQGIILRFDDGKAAILNINTDGTPRLQFRPNVFDNDASDLKTAFDKEWVEFYNVTAEEVQKYNSETGIVLKVAREGKYLHLFIDDVYHGRATLPDAYESKKMGFGLFGYDVVKGAKWYFNVTETLPDLSVSITDETATDAKGTITISQGVELGGTVTITLNPEEGYMRDKIIVSGGVSLTATGKNTFTFVAMEKTYTVTVTFKLKPENEAESEVSGIGLDNTAIDMDGKEITFTQWGIDTKYTVIDGKVKGFLDVGDYTVSCEGFYDLTATVQEDGTFQSGTNFVFEKKIFVYNIMNEPEKNFLGEGDNKKAHVGDVTAAAKDGVLKATGDGVMFEWSLEKYDNVAFTVTLKSGNGNQGLLLRLNESQKAVRVRIEEGADNDHTKAQWIGGEWWWGTQCNDLWDFGEGTDYAKPLSAELYNKFTGTDGLKFTILRKDAIVYILLDGKLYATQSLNNVRGENHSVSKVQVGYFAEAAKNGYTVPFKISTDVDAILAAAGTDVGTDLTVYGGAWTEEGATLKVAGRGCAEFKAEANTLKESATIKISDKVGGDQGFMYRFTDGKYIAVRYQKNGGNYKVQYTMDTVFLSDGSLKNWTDFMMTEAEKEAFDESGLDLTFIRDGKTFYTFLGDRLLDKADLDGAYASMNGAMGVMIWNGKNTAFAYEHKTGDNVSIPTTHTVTASIDGDAHGYELTYASTGIVSGKNVTLSVKTKNWESAWSHYPITITVDGTVVKTLTTEDYTSTAANWLTYTFTLENVTKDTDIKVKIEKGTPISSGVVVTVKDNVGGTATSDSGENGYYWNDACTLYINSAEGYEIASITVDGGDPITSGWEYNSTYKRYEYNIADPIHQPIAVEVAFKTATPAE